MTKEKLATLKFMLLRLFQLGDEVPEAMAWDWNYFWDHVYFDNVCTLGEFRKQVHVHNFLYDRMTGLVFVNLEIGDHAMFMGFLEQLHTKMSTEELREVGDGHCDLGDRYIQSDRGFYLSTVSDGIYKSSTMTLTAQEKMVFKEYHFYKF